MYSNAFRYYVWDSYIILVDHTTNFYWPIGEASCRQPNVKSQPVPWLRLLVRLAACGSLPPRLLAPAMRPRSALTSPRFFRCRNSSALQECALQEAAPGQEGAVAQEPHPGPRALPQSRSEEVTDLKGANVSSGLAHVCYLLQATDDTERAEHEKKFKTYREEMMYVYYYPKSEPYISLFPSAPHSDENQKRQKELRAEAIARFEKEQPTEAFHQFCFNDGKSKDSSSASDARPAVELLLKKPTKEMVKKQKKARSKRDKTGEKPKHTPALVDQDDDEDMQASAKAESDKEEEQEEEEDDFFL
ncbi:unnamed protein product [Phytophthora lilii]|uniref:rRNA-processing protein EFG1 n=1 Tax=Phytophthora lilii TaxID=2077276 RepID=A0A9W6TTQ6_9STRA|nr:unnamed protein product [Phytophthora lilii]